MYNHKDGVTLRKIRQSDLSDLLKLKSESWWGTHKTTIANNDDQLEWYQSIPKDQLFMIAEASRQIASGSLTCVLSMGVGVYTDIDTTSRCLKLSGSIYKEHRASDIVKPAFAAGLDFAFEVLNMERVEAEVLVYNAPARHLEIDYLGFVVEGRRRKAVYKCGEYYDSLVLGMLREEWKNSDRVKAYEGSCNKNFNHNTMSYMAENYDKKS
jgi:RimJ/RimL family protein N-acetyltransferase